MLADTIPYKVSSNDEPVTATPGNLSQNGSDDRAFHDAQVQEYNKIVKPIRLIRKTDDLDISVALALESTTQETPKIGTSDYKMDDALEMIHGLLSVEDVSKPELFNRKTLPFRIFRRALELQLVNPIKTEEMSSVTLSSDDREDPRLFEHLWFLLYIGGARDAIADNLRTMRENRSSEAQSVSQVDN